jgi:cytochrome c peroxidase
MKIRLAGSGLSRSLIGVLVLAGISVACISIYFRTSEEAEAVEVADAKAAASDEPIRPIEARADLNRGKTDLGRKLFEDARLSHDNLLSCASCHNLRTGGTDRKARSIGVNGTVGVINAPTVFNSGFNFSQFWGGRAPSLEKQIDGPVQSEIEMRSTWPEVIGKLTNSPEYVRDFRQGYGDGVTVDRIEDSIAEFERSLSTPNSRFDRYLRHGPEALTSEEVAGYGLFKSLGCASCHQGVNIGGNMYQKVGVMAPYFTDRGHIGKADLGRFNVTGDPRDMYMFKVPSLRNVALTAPYFHDGNVATLPDAVFMMAKYQLGHRLSDREVELIAGS